MDAIPSVFEVNQVSSSMVAILPILTQSPSVSNGVGWERFTRVSGLSESGGREVGVFPVLLQETNKVKIIRGRTGILIWRIRFFIPAANYRFLMVFGNDYPINVSVYKIRPGDNDLTQYFWAGNKIPG